MGHKNNIIVEWVSTIWYGILIEEGALTEVVIPIFVPDRIISLPFKTIPELVANTQYKILLIPGTSFEDSFRYSKDPVWQTAFKDRIEEHLPAHNNLDRIDFMNILLEDGTAAYYDNYDSIV